MSEEYDEDDNDDSSLETRDPDIASHLLNERGPPSHCQPPLFWIEKSKKCVEASSESHPFYTGKTKPPGGSRVDKFNKKHG